MFVVGPHPDLPGGVNQALSALMEELPEAKRLVVGRSERAPLRVWQGWRTVWAQRGRGLLHLNTSMRPRALARDMALSCGWSGPAVAWIHGWSEPLWGQLQAGRGAALVRHFCARVWPVVVSEAHRSRLIRLGVDPERIQVIGPPVRPDVVGRTGGRDDGPVVFVGRLHRDKGARCLLRARLNHAECFAGRELVFAGEGSGRVELERDAVPGVRFTGWLDVEGVRELLEEASVVVLPTSEDALPLTLVEALASEVPVVASPVGGIPALVGEGGLLVEPEPELVADAVARVRQQVSRSARQAAGARVRAAYSPVGVASRWREVYARALEGP